MPAKLSHHAAKRASQRLGLGVVPAERQAQAALELGLSPDDVAGQLKRWMQFQERSHDGHRLRVYGAHVFVFGARDNGVITILHLPKEYHRAARRCAARKLSDA